MNPPIFALIVGLATQRAKPTFQSERRIDSDNSGNDGEVEIVGFIFGHGSILSCTFCAPVKQRSSLWGLRFQKPNGDAS
jgi:hypothetical protein